MNDYMPKKDADYIAEMVSAYKAGYLAGLAAAKEGAEQALEHVASVGWPVGPDGKYSRDGEWIFMDALPKEVDAAEIKAAHTILRATLTNLTALEQEAKK